MTIYKFERRISCDDVWGNIKGKHGIGVVLKVTWYPFVLVRRLYNIVNIPREFGVNALTHCYSQDDMPLSVFSQSLRVYTHS